LLQRIADILEFIEAGIRDSDLPFLLISGGGTCRLHRKGPDGTPQPISIFQNLKKWPVFLQEAFDTYQWQLLAPYFPFSTKEKPKVFQLALDDRVVFPYIEDDESGAARSDGGFSDVWRVKIHPAHHNGCHSSVGSLCSRPLEF